MASTALAKARSWRFAKPGYVGSGMMSLPAATRGARRSENRSAIFCSIRGRRKSRVRPRCCCIWRPEQLVAEVIRPALESGKTVLADRFLLANVVYQGHAGGLDVEELWRIGRTATGGLQPNLTVVLDMSPEAALRLTRPLDRMELEGVEFQRRLREGFLSEAGRRPGQILLIDAARPVDVVQADIRRAIEERL